MSARNGPVISERIDNLYIATGGDANTTRHIEYEVRCSDIQGLHSVCMLYPAYTK